MRVLLLTGRKAAPAVRRAAAEFDWAEVRVLPIDVAALMTTGFVLRHLRGEDLSRYDYVLLPGLFRGDVERLDRELGADFRLSSRDARDLPLVLRKMEEGFEPAKDRPACELLREEILREMGRRLREAEREIPEDRWVDVGPIRVARGCRPRVLSEIFADDRDPGEVAREAERRVRCGAEIVDLGFHEADPRRVSEVVEEVRGRVGERAAVSVDAGDAGLIEAGVEAGAQLILSAGPGLEEPINVAAEYEVPVVLIPRSRRIGPAIRELEDLVERCERAGVEYILDPLLDPPGEVLRSLRRAWEVARRFPDAPLFFGAGNVIELIDADSVGASALCAQLAVELEASIVFTPEASGKTVMSTLELAVASRMCYYAHRVGGYPKDLGVDLLVFKDKHVESSRSSGVPAGRFVRDAPRDPRGSVVIDVNHERGVIVAEHVHRGEGGLRLESEDGLELGLALVSLGLVSRLEHAVYLGYELARAEERLRSRGRYVQEGGIERYDALMRELDRLREEER